MAKKQKEQPQEQPQKTYSEMDLIKARQRRDLAVKKRLQAMRDAETDEERESLFLDKNKSEVKKPTTFKEKWSHYWYLHKYVTIWSMVFVLIAGFLTYDLISKEKFDINIYIFDAYYRESDDILQLTQDLNAIIPDIDGNGEGSVNIEMCQLDIEGRGEYSDTYVTSQLTLTGVISTAEDYVMLIDEPIYETLLAEGIEFIDLTTLSDNENIDGDKFYVTNSSLFDSLIGSDDVFLVVRDLSTTTESSQKNNQDEYTSQCEIAKSILNHTYGEY